MLITGASGEALAQAFQTIAPTAILLDADTRAVLFEKNADELVAPASMAKIMTAEVLFNELKSGRVTMDSTFTVSVNAWKKGGAGSGGSAMFAKVNEPVRVEDLLRGLVIQSGNDAAIAIAEGISGTEENFARLMTERARQIGLTKSTFRNATGYSEPDQKVTVRELAMLSLHVIETYPEYYKMFGEKDFTWNKIRQVNRNPLLDDGYRRRRPENRQCGRIRLRPGRLRGPERAAPRRRRQRDEDRPRSRGRIPQAPGMGLSLIRAPSPLRARTGGGRRGGVRRGSPVAAACLRAAGSCTRAVAETASDSRRASSIKARCKAPIRKGAEVATSGHRGDTKALEMPLYASEDVRVGTLRQRAFDGLLEVSTGWVRRTLVGCVQRDLMAGTFITFEGGEGRAIHPDSAASGPDRARRGCRVVATREPGGSP